MGEKKFFIKKKRGITDDAPQTSADESSSITPGPQFEQKEAKREEETTVIEPVTSGEPVRTEPMTAQDVVQWFIDFFGEDVFRHIKDNPNFRLSLVDEETSVTNWLTRALKTFLSFDDLLSIGQRIRFNTVHYETRIAEIEEANRVLEQNLEHAEQKVGKAETAVRSAEAIQHKLRNKIKASMPLQLLIDNFLATDPSTAPIVGLLREAMEDPVEDLPDFTLGLTKGWLAVSRVFELEITDEKQRMETMHETLKKLLCELSGKIISQRRDILQNIAAIVSSGFKDYDFVSPEEALQVDPSVHKAIGLGGTKVKEGITFAVVRKNTRQTVVYAEIKVS